ncbi:MAG: hypothetical protein AABX14_02675 [Candidatus Aenigmatarchaeota archaeon]
MPRFDILDQVHESLMGELRDVDAVDLDAYKGAVRLVCDGDTVYINPERDNMTRSTILVEYSDVQSMEGGKVRRDSDLRRVDDYIYAGFMRKGWYYRFIFVKGDCFVERIQVPA